jgi:hypothetical protein
MTAGKSGWDTSTDERQRETMFSVDQLHTGRKESEVLSENDSGVLTGVLRAVKPLGRRGWGEDIRRRR